jgi:glutathione-regulated potassium-efflux system ancillary protein KefC
MVGAETARMIVVAIDGPADSLALVDAIRQNFPHLTILARARNVSHYYDLMDRGVTLIERETFEAALLMGGKVLRELGYGGERVEQVVNQFRDHNFRTLLAVYPHYQNQDQHQMISLAKQGRQELEDMFARDATGLPGAAGGNGGEH